MDFITLKLNDSRKKLKESPKELKVFSFGENVTSKGTFIMSESDAESIMKAWKEQGNKLNFDYNHSQLSELANPESQISAGTFDLELRESGLYATNIEWTDKADQLILHKEYLYISPAFLISEDNHISELINVALTNIPATKNMKELLAAKKGFNMEKENQEIIQEEKETVELEAVSEVIESEDISAESVDEIQALKDMVLALEERVKALEALQSSSEEKDVEKEELKKELSALKCGKLISDAISKGKILPSNSQMLSCLSFEVLEKELGKIPEGIISLGKSRAISEEAKEPNLRLEKYRKQLGLK